MIVSCPRCATGFALNDAALGNSGRKVRCGSCGHVWLQLAQSGPSLDSPVTMEPALAVISDAPGCLPPDLLEVDEPIGAGALDVAPIDLVVPDAGAEFAGEGEEAMALEPSDAEIMEPETAGAEAGETAAAPAEAEAAGKPAVAEKGSAIPAAWRSPKLAALAPLVAAIAEDKARHGDLPAQDAAPEAPTPPAPDQSEPPQASIVVVAEASIPETAADAALEGAQPEATTPESATPEASETIAAFVPVEIAAPELALLAATTFTPTTMREAAPETVALPPIDIPGPPEPPAILVALRDDRAKEGDGLDAIAPPPAPVIDDDLRPEETVAPEIAAANLRRHRRLRYGAAIGALALIMGGLVANEATQSDGTSLLAAIKTGGAPPAETGLGFANVSTQRTAVGGVPMLMVTGEVVNDSHRPRAVPILRGALLTGEREVQIWTFNAGMPRLDPGQRASFETVLRNPANGATDVRVTFSAPGS